ncbi:hypothetical protein [Tetrasphaera phage TJE1]|uniref:Uncharacterized protein n=1 Tax=Tetrasphaera phage TJE1 TaxID=981335 RepID=G4W970_9CAUD|nr:hypothetical protein G185_gp38 [Tetrasphaera phage TJE1]ADX42558.1 hypothetical protein [Tetrasphaera phage TJE1]
MDQSPILRLVPLLTRSGTRQTQAWTWGPCNDLPSLKSLSGRYSDSGRWVLQLHLCLKPPPRPVHVYLQVVPGSLEHLGHPPHRRDPPGRRLSQHGVVDGVQGLLLQVDHHPRFHRAKRSGQSDHGGVRRMSLIIGNQFPLFDKIVNITLTQKTGESSYVLCPKVGRKPTINVSGKIWPSPILADLDVRITNLYTGDTPLDAYKYLKFEAGYAGSLAATIEGEVVNAYQETPGPDGVTVFKMLQGGFTNWTNVTMSQNWPAGTSVNTILSDLAGMLQLSLKTTVSASLQTAVPWSFTGLVKDFLTQISTVLNITLYPSGPFLVAYQVGGNTGLVHVIQHFITAPRHEASGYNFTSPWDPTLRPGDVVVVDTRYMRQTYGGAQVGNLQTRFIAQTISFDFGTTDETNSMIVLATEEPA